MKYRFASTGYDKTTMGRNSVDRENATRCSVSGGKPNWCVIFPGNVSMVAEALERRNKNWIVRTKTASDLIVQVGDSSFHLHKLPMVSKSEYLNRLVFQRSNGERGNSSKIHIDNLPGGAETFELVVKFCYGWKVDVTAVNVAALYCAAHFLEMSDDLDPGNLISKTEAFLSFVIFSSWKDTFQILKGCESVPAWAKELQILKRCSEAIAWKVCINPIAFAFDDNAQVLESVINSINDTRQEGMVDNWWLEDVSSLRIDHFVEVIESIKRQGMKSELVGLCIAKWTAKWLSQITYGLSNMTPKYLTNQLRSVTTESLIRVLPEEENSVSCNFLLHLLKLGLMMIVNAELLNKLERRIASMLEQCCVPDLLVKNHGENETVYDVNIVLRVVEHYVSFVLSNPAPRIFVVGRLVDGFLTLIARDKNLTAKSFQSLAEALPKCARHCDDNLYRAMDIYMKAHPSLTEDERTSVCRAIEYHKLSQEARQHMMKNDRLPLKMRTRFILLEQVNMTRSMTAAGSNYRRTKTQTIIRVSRSLEKGYVTSQKEIKMMKKEVEMMKMQLNELQMCKIQLQKQVKRCR